MSEENKNIVEQEPVEQEQGSIDFRKILKDMRKHKRKYFIVLPVIFIVTAILSMALPNYYRCTVKLSPEMSSMKGNMGLLSLYSMGSSAMTPGLGSEALYPMLYPEVVKSTDFQTSLFHIPVTIESRNKSLPPRTMTYYDYLLNEQKSPWWGKVVAAPFILLGKILPQEEEDTDTNVTDTLDPFRLTKKQAKIAKAIGNKVTCEVDKKTMVITINVTDQSPVVAAVMADSVKVYLQKFITDYRTSKARGDLAYNKILYQEAKVRYDNARKEYSRYVDANTNVILQTVRQRQIDLENELQIQYNAYMQVANQVLAAEAKVQEETPAFTTIQSASVPVRKAGPSRAKKCLVWTFLAFLIVTAWVFYKEDDFGMFFGEG